MKNNISDKNAHSAYLNTEMLDWKALEVLGDMYPSLQDLILFPWQHSTAISFKKEQSIAEMGICIAVIMGIFIAVVIF